MKANQVIQAVAALSALTLAGCAGDSSSFSVLPTANNFQQSAQSINTKIDILWVVDNSGSMETSQQNLANNFPTFIDGFTQRDLDFQIAVTTSDAFLSLPSMTSFYTSWPGLYEGRPQNEKSQFRDGVGANHTGVNILTHLTPNLSSVFVTNAMQGIYGYGDERPLQSFRAALENPLNAGFVRSNSFLAVILLTDEDDFSHDGTDYLENQYANPNLHSIQSYVDFLDVATGSTTGHRKYSASSIAINDANCLNQLNTTFTGRKIGQRVGALADATGGIKASLCGSFANELELIANNIIELSTQFYLNRLPIPETIAIWVNGTPVPSVASNQGPMVGGWTYHADTNSVVFSGDYVPQQGAQISVYFDPAGLN